ncbi:MAG: hypothetical protein RLY71_2057 [Pseudomonadota bacterium]|jgi:serine/threonine-protein kinase
MMEPLPARIGPYPVHRLIGAGAMGLVYLGHDPAINRLVAIKTIRKHLLGNKPANDDTADRFRLEAQAAGRLHHPGIVGIYQFGEDHDCDYIAMEYVEGHNLSDYLARQTRFSREDVLCLMNQLLEALDYAHNNGVIHRDIKPANLLISHKGQLKITDFGIARLESTQLTRTNMMVGSPGFMAPEQYTDAVLDRRVDVFAAGVLLYDLLAGKLPFSGSNEAVMYKVMNELPEPLQPDAEGRDFADFWPIVLTALAKQPAQRYGSARAMLDALAGLVRNEPIGPLLAITCVLPARTDQPAPAGPTPPSRHQTGAPSGRPATQPATGSAPPWPTGWNEATLSGLEHDLARHVGPIAKMVVRKSARHFATLEGVRQDVANVITDPVERQHFLQQTRALTAMAARPGTTDSARRAESAPSRFADSRLPDSRLPNPAGTHPGQATQLDTAALERIGAVLTRTLGPIAKVLVRRCAARSSQRDEFIELLLAQLDPRIDREALRRQLLTALQAL